MPIKREDPTMTSNLPAVSCATCGATFTLSTDSASVAGQFTRKDGRNFYACSSRCAQAYESKATPATMRAEIARDYVGSVSSGTMRPADLIPAFLSTLAELAARTRNAVWYDAASAERGAMLQRLDAIAAELADIERATEDAGDDYYDSEEAGYTLEWLFDTLDELAPAGTTFGAHEGDGADYGFWPVDADDDTDDDAEPLTLTDPQSVPPRAELDTVTWRGMTFVRMGTGGNCDCWERTETDGTYRMITNGDGNAPCTGERAVYSVYADEQHALEADARSTEQVAAFLPDGIEQTATYRVAVRFCEIIREWLTAAELAEVVAANLFNDPSVCATHDYCDANVAMDQAMTDAGVSTEDADTWNAAWDIAKASGFTLQGGA